MKRLIALLSALTMTFSFASCSDKEEVSSVPESEPAIETTEEETTEEETTEEETTEEVTEEETEEPTEAPTEAATAEEITEIVTEPPTEAKILNSSDYVAKIGESIEITDITTMQAASIGALNGSSFMYNGNKFEIYRFDEEHSTLASAADGTVTLTIAGWGEFSTNSSVNGSYLMVYNTIDETVIQAFNSVQ